MVYWLKNMSKWKLALSLTLAGVVVAGGAVAIAVPLVLNSKSSSHVNPKHSLPDLSKVTKDALWLAKIKILLKQPKFLQLKLRL